MYEYYWGHTKAQVELMTVDAVYTCYKKDDKPQSGERKPPSPEKMEEVARKWKENRNKRKFTLESFIGSKDTPGDSENKTE